MEKNQTWEKKIKAEKERVAHLTFLRSWSPLLPILSTCSPSTSSSSHLSNFRPCQFISLLFFLFHTHVASKIFYQYVASFVFQATIHYILPFNSQYPTTQTIVRSIFPFSVARRISACVLSVFVAGKTCNMQPIYSGSHEAHQKRTALRIDGGDLKKGKLMEAY